MSDVDHARLFAHAQRPAGLSEHADCTVRGFAAATGVSYAIAHEIAAEAGRKHRQTFHLHKILRVAKRRGFKARKLRFRVRALDRFIREYPRGRYYVAISGHAFAIVDGVPSEPVSDYCRIIEAYEMTAPVATVPSV